MDSGVPNFDNFLVPENNEAPSKVLYMDGHGSLLPTQNNPSNPLLGCNRRRRQQQILSSSVTPQKTMSFKTFTAFPSHQQPPSSFPTTIGYGNESWSGEREPFTPSQLMELGHQTLIYSYISANKAVPLHLLAPLRNSQLPFRLPAASSAEYCLQSNPTRLGGLRQSYGGIYGDPEPGRCRRTDGKKWRCSRKAIADQKYCERHMYRGRHRSRRPKEAMVPVTSGAAYSSSLMNPKQEVKNLEAASANSEGVSMASTIKLKPEGSIFKEEFPIKEQFQSEIGIFSSDFFIDPSHTSSFLTLNDQNHLNQFNEDWTSDFSISSSDKLALEFDPAQRGLGENDELGNLSQNQSSWMANSFQETSLGSHGNEDKSSYDQGWEVGSSWGDSFAES